MTMQKPLTGGRFYRDAKGKLTTTEPKAEAKAEKSAASTDAKPDEKGTAE